MPRRRRRPEGFTLLEALLALSAGALVASLTAGMIAQTADVRDELARRGRLLRDARAALWILRDELATHRPGTLRIERRSANAAPVLAFERDAPDPERVIYRLADGRLERSVRRRLHGRARPRRDVLTGGVRRFDVVALGDDGWRDAWATPRAPAALTLTLDCLGAPPLTVAVVPVARGPA